MKTIFIQISSYHDFELPRTILDAINKSSGENQINFGIHLTYYEKDEIILPNIANIKKIKHKAPESIGVGMGRYLANTLYDNEDYYLQIDSHMRFEQDWDKKIINDYESYVLQGYNPIITSYPASYWYEDFKVNLMKNAQVHYCKIKNDEESISLFKKTKILSQEAVVNKGPNVYTYGVSAAVVFGSGSLAKIEPNKKMFFWGEETVMSLRFFTHGYDLVLPSEQLFYHLYYNHEDPASNLRRLVGHDFPNESQNINYYSEKEIRRIVDNKIVGDQELGSVRSIEDFENYAKINFKDGVIYEH